MIGLLEGFNLKSPTSILTLSYANCRPALIKVPSERFWDLVTSLPSSVIYESKNFVFKIVHSELIKNERPYSTIFCAAKTNFTKQCGTGRWMMSLALFNSLPGKETIKYNKSLARAACSAYHAYFRTVDTNYKDKDHKGLFPRIKISQD